MQDCPNAKGGFEEMVDKMCGFTPSTLASINRLAPEFIDTIHSLDKVVNEDGAIDRKNKRLMALACVCVRMCEDCVYQQAKVCKNYGATQEEILEAIKVAVMIGGVPCWSIAKKGITKLFSEWDDQSQEGDSCEGTDAEGSVQKEMLGPAPGETREAPAKYICTICGEVYDPEYGDPDAGIAPGTPFESLPDDWSCPVCGADKSMFKKME